MKYAIDGSNVLLGLRLDKKPSIRLFIKLLSALRDRHDEFHIFFDDSIRYIMDREGLGNDWARFVETLRYEGISPVYAPRADPLIERFCKEQSAALINSSDKMDSWNTRPTVVHRARAFRYRGGLYITLMDDLNGQFVMRAPAHEPFSFGVTSFPSLDPNTSILERPITSNQDENVAVAEGTLLVLALDASGSMTESNTYDGRAKSVHLNEVVKSAVTRLRNSKISDGLYVAVLRFENTVTPLRCPRTDTYFASIADWQATISEFDYLAGISPGQTNIRLALQRAKELIQETVADADSVSALADAWRATVILITDGLHYVERLDGTVETDKDVASAILSIHMGASDLIGSKIDVGCVGIGTDVNSAMLGTIASRCTPQQLKMARNAGIANLLVNNQLFIRVDSARPGFSDAIRSFIDVASASA